MRKLGIAAVLLLWCGTAFAQTWSGKLPANNGWGNTSGAEAAPTPVPFSGNGSKIGTTSGSLVNGHCVSIDASGNLIDAGGACTTGGGGGTVSAGTAGQMAVYGSTGTVVSGVTMSGSCTLNTSTGVITCATGAQSGPTNCGLSASVASNNLTVTLTDASGGALSSSSPCTIPFRNATVTNGATTYLSIQAPISVTLNSGSTLGTTNNVSFRVWVGVVNDAGTARLVVQTASDATRILLRPEYVLIGSLACNACNNATLALAPYSTVAVTSVPWKIMGYLDWAGGLPTAGAWSTGPTEIQNMTPNTPLPGSVIQTITTTSTSQTTNSTCGAFANTTLAATIGLFSRINGVAVSYRGSVGSTVVNKAAYTMVNRGGTNVGGQTVIYGSATQFATAIADDFLDLPDSTAGQTYTVGLTCDPGGSANFPNAASTNGKMSLSEIMR